jgi:tRNA-dihydrouridine synthase A
MVVDKTIIHTEHLDMHLWFPKEQHPIVLQVGGSDPATLREAAAKAVQYGYDEINLNCGCPSDRVAGAGCFGAAMMLQPALVAECMRVCVAYHPNVNPSICIIFRISLTITC